MDALCLHLEVMAGGCIGDTAIMAQGISNTLGIAVRYTFNGTPCLHVPGGSSESVAAGYITSREHATPASTQSGYAAPHVFNSKYPHSTCQTCGRDREDPCHVQ
jgi:hypothetical protein